MVDDVNQEKGYRPNDNMLKLIEDYGIKFSLFIPASFRGNEITKEFIDEIQSNNNFEICAHGLLHDINDNPPNAQEFKDLSQDEIKSKMVNINQIWSKNKYKPKVWKSPGWSTPLYIYDYLREYKYTSLCDHFIDDTYRMYNNIKRIPYHNSIDNLPKVVTKDLLILQSHISSIGGSENIWNDENTIKFGLWLEDLMLKVDVEFIFIGEI